MTLAQDIEVSPRGRVLKLVRQMIDNGRLREGDLVPSGREIADKLKVSRGVVRLALDELLREGLLEEREGRSLSVARQRRGGSLTDGAVVVLTPAPDPSENHRSPGWIEYIAQGAIAAIRRTGRSVIIMDPTRLERHHVDVLLADRPGGVVFPEIPDSEFMPLDTLDRLRGAGIPVVMYGGDPKLRGYDRVRSDHEAGAYMLARELIRRGHRNIRCYFDRDSLDRYWCRARLAGYERAMVEAGLEALPPLSYTPLPGEAAGSDAMEFSVQFEARSRLQAGYLLDVFRSEPAPSALMLLTDGQLAEVAAGCRLLGRVPGEHVQLVGYDNYWQESPERQFEPAVPLATIDKRNRAAGEEMVRLLMDRLEGRLGDGPQERLVAPELVLFDEITSRR